MIRRISTGKLECCAKRREGKHKGSIVEEKDPRFTWRSRKIGASQMLWEEDSWQGGDVGRFVVGVSSVDTSA